ncbi:flagellar filament capping protein FliD [bacterium]|nr:flagellar filament capping protein FliD [bacterium]
MATFDYLGTQSNVTSISSLVSKALESQQSSVKKIESTKTDLSERISILSTLKTKLKTLSERVESFTDVGTSKAISAKSAESSDDTIFTGEADSTAVIGVNTLFVSQIAKNDIVISDRITASDTDIAEKYEGSTISFSLQVGSGTSKTISINIDDADETNAELLTRIKDEINNSGAGVAANVISDTSTTKRLTIVSDDTGSSNEIELTDISSPKFLKDIGMLSNGGRTEASGTSGGYIYSDTSDLNSIFTLNGIQIENDSNDIEDILTGVTITLKKAQSVGDSTETISIAADAENIREQIDGFIEDYNDVIKYLNTHTSVDSTTYTRGALSSDVTIRSLRLTLRSIVSGNVSTAAEGNPMNITEIGISIDSSGLLTLDDEDEFTDVLEAGDDAVTDLFDSDEGIAVRLEAMLDSYILTGGVIDDARSAVNLKITTATKQQSSLESRLKIEEGGLFKRYSNYYKNLSRYTSQKSLFEQYSTGSILNLGSSSGGTGFSISI